MNGTRRLLTWFGAGTFVVMGAPAAYASTAVPAAAAANVPAAVSADSQPRDAAQCGGSPADFAGGFREVQYPEIGYLFDTEEGSVTAFYRGAPIVEGQAFTDPGVISWTFDGTTVYESKVIVCGDGARPTKVTAIVAESGSDQVSLVR